MRFTAALRKSRLGNSVVAPRGQIATFPSPTRGWNARDPLSGMKPGDAIFLDNYLPTTANVQLRKGSRPTATGMGAGKVVETLAEFTSGGTDEMFAWAGGKVFDVSAEGAVGAPVVAGPLLSNRWQTVLFDASVGNERLVCVDGLDDMLQYDGTTWHVINTASAPIAITNVDTKDLIYTWTWKNRLFFIEKNTMNAWCLDVDVFGGAAHKIPLGGLFKDGGYLVAGGNWTRDGGDGMNNLCVFMTNKGEIAVYAGSDPTDATKWSLIGVYKIGAPVGQRPIIKSGADLAIICLDGIVGLSTVISLDRAASNSVALSDRIRGAFAEATALYKNNFGWQAVSYPAGSQVFFNVPIAEGQTQYQFILNAVTGAWCRFKGLNANCWCLYKERMYFGNNNGEVWIADDGDSDNNVEIEGLIKTAFIYHNGNALKKEYKQAKPIFFSDVSLPFGIALAVDFDDSVLAPSTSGGVSSGSSFWDTSTWDVDPWATIVPIKSWRKVNGVGTCASVIITTKTKGFPVTLNSTDILFESGGIL